MDRQRQLRFVLVDALRPLEQACDELDLVDEIPLLAEVLDDIAEARVVQARAAGASWADIAERLGVTRQAAHKRFGEAARRRRGPQFDIHLDRTARRLR